MSALSVLGSQAVDVVFGLCRQIAARTLGDLVRKLGEKILPEIIPILEEGLRSPKSDERQGVCIGLSEIMKSTSRDAVSICSLLAEEPGSPRRRLPCPVGTLSALCCWLCHTWPSISFSAFISVL